ncbi:unnamed protein product [Heligmosomoides polygyrus]|uniref:Endo/exonuclease/phosphatase domain-containing protein n=1 Tax=Heligmosomoides polygyrus TaxID=6339 RepID=A0A183GU65_HELPZ|nr:unnamed protein product [Heligmosomoides polygyrus]
MAVVTSKMRVANFRFRGRSLEIYHRLTAQLAELFRLLDEKTAEVPPKEVIIVAGDLNGHIDFALVKDHDRSIATDAKIVPCETVAPQHRPLICTIKMAPPRLMQIERCGAARIKWWRMKEKEVAVISRVRLPTVTTVDETWKKATDAIREAARLELGITKLGRRKVDKQTRLWTDDVKAKVREKKSLYQVFLGDKTADNWQKYQNAKTRHRHTKDIEKFFCINDESSHLLTERKKALKRWCDNFKGILTEEFLHPAVPSVAPIDGPVHNPQNHCGGN